MSTAVSVDPFPEITAGITAAGDVVKLTDDVLNFLNSPTMVAGRKAVQEAAIVAKEDADLKAAQQETPGALAKADAEASG